jgi:predicted 3-demethylubiquinone-9 3-methyltransferase (glyoxalase superfamily)
MAGQEMAICLWYDDQAEEAARFYTSIFRDAEIGRITRYGKEGFEFHGKPEGTAMTVDFRLNGMKFVALNGGPQFKFNEAVSIMVHCDTQEEIDHYWSGLTEGGEEGPCGWLRDRFGVSWQIVPSMLPKYLTDGDGMQVARVRQAIFQMKKLDISRLREAFEGSSASV